MEVGLQGGVEKEGRNGNIKFDENSPIHTGYVRINT